MIVKPRTKNYICITAHPEGCREMVNRQIGYIKSQIPVAGAKKVLVIGASSGYGLSSRICAAYSSGAATLGVVFEKPPTKTRTATAGWYNTAAFELCAKKDGLYAETINGDAFSQEVKQQTVDRIRKELGQVDLVIYSLAAPRRTAPDGETYQSVLKTIDQPFTNKSLNMNLNQLEEVTIEPASPEELSATVKVMGGEDWELWLDLLQREGVLAEGARTVAYSYSGSEMTYPIYRDGTIGIAKNHLLETAQRLNAKGINAFVSLNKALVTQASCAIPIVPLYISVLYRVMKEQGTDETTVEQIYRLWNEYLFKADPVTDEYGRIRLDDRELSAQVQQQVVKNWNLMTNDNLYQCADIEGYWADFYHLFGFQLDEINYDQDVDIELMIPSLKEKE